MRPGALLIHPEVCDYVGLPEPLERPSNVFFREVVTRGNLDEGFSLADVVVENTFTVSRTHQAFLEPHGCVAWVDDAGRLQVWAPNKAPHGLKDTLATALGLPADSIRINPVTIGGDFGGKGAAMDEPLCCLLAMRSGRPVKMLMDYRDELTAGAPRHAAVFRLKTGVTRDGAITAYQMEAVLDSGAYGGLRPGAAMPGPSHGAGCYKIPNARIEVMRVYTNNIPGGQFRAPGEPQGIFAAESHMDCVAHRLGMDPLEFRLRNLIEDGDETVNGSRYQGVRAKETLRAAVEAAGYASPRPPNVGRGMAMGFRSPGGGESAVSVSLHADGSVVVGTPVYEQGTGTYTSLRQIVAEELGLPPDRIQVSVLDTDQTPFDSGIGGSRGTRIVTGSAFQAVREVTDKLRGVAAEILGWPSEKVAIHGDEIVRHDTGERRYWPDLLAQAGQSLSAEVVNKDTSRATVTSFTAQVAEVSVDPETGAVRLLRFTTAHDVGVVLNPIGHQGQIDGAVVQGVGYGLMEELRVEEGRVITTHFGDFKIPTTRDIPELQTVLLESGLGVGPYNIKGIGENPIVPVAAAIGNAVEDAVGVRVRDLPLTAEKVYRALDGGLGAA